MTVYEVVSADTARLVGRNAALSDASWARVADDGYQRSRRRRPRYRRWAWPPDDRGGCYGGPWYYHCWRRCVFAYRSFCLSVCLSARLLFKNLAMNVRAFLKKLWIAAKRNRKVFGEEEEDEEEEGIARATNCLDAIQWHLTAVIVSLFLNCLHRHFKTYISVHVFLHKDSSLTITAPNIAIFYLLRPLLAGVLFTPPLVCLHVCLAVNSITKIRVDFRKIWGIGSSTVID